MSSSKDRPGSWRAEIGDVSDTVASERDAILESLATPLPPEIDRERRERIPSQAESVASRPDPTARGQSGPRRVDRAAPVELPHGPAGDPSLTPTSYGPLTEDRRGGVRRKSGLRRVKRTLRHVDPISIFKLSLFLSACLLVLWLLFVAVLYWIADTRGLFDVIDSLREGFALDWQEDITLMFVEKWAFLIGFTAAVLSSLLALLLAFVYNAAADFLGGAEMTFVERDS